MGRVVRAIARSLSISTWKGKDEGLELDVDLVRSRLCDGCDRNGMAVYRHIRVAWVGRDRTGWPSVAVDRGMDRGGRDTEHAGCGIRSE